MTGALVAIALANALATAWRSSWTDDERMHLAWSERLLEDGVTERTSHYLYNSKTPITVPNALARSAAAAAGAGPEMQRFCARLPTVAWLAALLLASFLLARQLAGARAACLAAAALSLDPNLVAHGSLVTTDVAFALAALLVAWAGVAFARAPSARAGAWLGAAAAFAVTAKFTALLVVPLAVALPFALRVPTASGAARRGRAIAAGLGVAAAVAWIAICASYGFIGVAGAGHVQWESGAMEALSGPLAPLFALFPADFLSGIDQVLADERTHRWNAVILATRHPDGVWFYFALLWLVKTPLGLLAGVVSGSVALVRERVLGRDRARLTLLALAGLALAYFSLAFRAQVGYRFALFCLPLVYIVVAPTWASLAATRRGAIALAALALLALAELAPFAGNPLAFTNSFVWNKRIAYRIVADSNLDWGQNDERAKAWAEQHGAHLDPHHVLPGTNLIGGNYLAGVFSAWRLDWLTWNRDPDGEQFHTHFVFEITDEEFSRFLDETRTADPTASAPCDIAPHTPRIDFAGSARTAVDLDGAGVLDLCVHAADSVDLFVLARNRASVGLRDARGRCAPEPLFAGQQAWMRLPAGNYRLCMSGRGRAGVEIVRGNGVLGRPGP